jgi:hypothetical protein
MFAAGYFVTFKGFRTMSSNPDVTNAGLELFWTYCSLNTVLMTVAVAAGVLPVQYGDDILIVLQENYSVENVERRLWKILSNSTLTPLMRLFDIPKERVLFYENLVNREAVIGPDWPFRWREPTFLDPIQLMLVLKEYEKR